MAARNNKSAQPDERQQDNQQPESSSDQVATAEKVRDIEV